MSQDSIGIALALISSICFAANRAFVSKPLLKTGSRIATYISLIVGVVLTGIASVVFEQESALLLITILAFVVFALVGIFHFGLARQLSFIAIKNLGSNQAAPLISTQVLYSLAFAIAFLGETVNLELIAGAAVILFGVLILEQGSGAALRGGSAKRGYTAALCTALVFGLTPILIKFGIGIFPHFIVATFVAYLAATIVFSFVVRPSSFSNGLRAMPRSILLAYVASGAFAAAAQLTRFGALSFSTVVLVAPILSSHPIFTVLFTRKIAKEYETFGVRLLLSIALVIIGTLLVSYSSGILA